MNVLKNIHEEDNTEGYFTVTSVNWKGHKKRLTLQPGRKFLLVPLSACVSQGDQIRLVDGEAWVVCRNGEAQFLQPYLAREMLAVGGFQLEVL